MLLTPVATRPPVAAAAWEGLGAVRTLLGMGQVLPYTGIWNMTGQPAISVPAPAGGLPVGAQLIAPPDGEPLLLSLSAQLERELGWPQRRPPSLSYAAAASSVAVTPTGSSARRAARRAWRSDWPCAV